MYNAYLVNISKYSSKGDMRKITKLEDSQKMRIQNMRVLKKMKMSTKRERKNKAFGHSTIGWLRPRNNSSNQNTFAVIVILYRSLK